ncbi:restriction endonuclease [Mycobacterium kansasii]|uniref:Eco57I restriction-modification methylase domain-containing protein n=1 Tax=Mycobacterium kansasii TaxID=1768 RepID=UPI000CDDC994|nr:DNA methyltransferase [Mycobacterium kansasii]POY04831.1 restriction endonuclease [Mycobacterium kansasii]POY29156.1 restriction endonuclease [Mycobacterium kansasii]
MSTPSVFRAVRIVGTALPAEAIPRVSEVRMPGQSAGEYDLPPGMTVNGAIARAWEAMLAAHLQWRTMLGRLPEGDPAIKLTREKWLLPLLYELGWGRPEVVGGGLSVRPGLGESTAPNFPISHRVSWPDAANPLAWVPIHLAGAGVDLDTKTASVTARAPQSMLQDYLNREHNSLWGILSNGHRLRLLRDASSLTRQSYVEFDLDAIFTDQLYADFRLLFLVLHASRFAPRLDESVVKVAATDGEEAEEGDVEPASLKLDNCWLERWRRTAIDDGARALLNLQQGVAAALHELGTGFVSHPANTALREALAAASDADRDLQRALLRIAYRLIVLFVVEDRDLLHGAAASAEARALYADYFSTARLRRLAGTPIGGWHTDLWEAHQIVTDALSGDGLAALGLSGLGATLFSRDALSILEGAKLPNRALLAAVRALAQIEDPVTGTPRPVDYRNLDSEELGGMYESLLAYTPRYNADDRTFTLDVATGSERKKSGSYYTPSELIALVLDEALDPLIDEALRSTDPEAALLDLSVVDPACGSGHFVVAAARRIAAALATVRTGDTEPAPAALRAATADVIEHCVYGVDLNDLAIEITKVALWLEAFDADRPFPFLDAHFRVGNALLGTTPELLRHNIPDAAFVALGDDDKTWTSKLKARNKSEREANAGQLNMFGAETLNVETTQFSKAAHEADTGIAATVAAMRARADAWRRLEEDPELKAAKLVADAWCAAFVQPKTGATTSGQGITHGTLRDLAENPESVSDTVKSLIKNLARQYRFFHWHLEFPGIFTVPDDGGADPVTGWTGGFSCVVGNPPWERVKIQDKEFFGNAGRPDIEGAATAAIRKKMIDQLADSDPDLFAAYHAALRQSDGTAHLLLKTGRYPLTGRGDVNTYSVFAETMRTVTGPHGAAGIISPTGLATDKTTAPFFADTLSNRRLSAFYDFENEAKIFRDVDHRVRFAMTTMTGSERRVQRTKFAFLNRHISDVPERRFQLAAEEVLKLNPNTGTLPMFRSRIDADITLGIYSRHPVLIRDDDPNGNPWGLSFARLFDMTNDSGLFHQADDLSDATFNGWSYKRDGKEYVPLYEAKMLSHFDHRYGTYKNATQAQLSVGSLPRPTDKEHDDANFELVARFWVSLADLSARLENRWDRAWMLGGRGITNMGNERTFVPSVLPGSAVGNSFYVAFLDNPNHGPLLHATWSSLVFDYVARQKLSGSNVNQFVVKQLACPTPNDFAGATPWHGGITLGDWALSYVLELSYTSWRLKPYAEDLRDNGPPFRWDPDRRTLLRADLDAAFLHVYGLNRGEAEHVLDSFPVVRKYEERDLGEYKTRRLVLEAYDRMAHAIANGGKGWKPLADIPAGEGLRHSK